MNNYTWRSLLFLILAAFILEELNPRHSLQESLHLNTALAFVDAIEELIGKFRLLLLFKALLMWEYAS